jgi:hypothetical protein
MKKKYKIFKKHYTKKRKLSVYTIINNFLELINYIMAKPKLSIHSQKICY